MPLWHNNFANLCQAYYCFVMFASDCYNLFSILYSTLYLKNNVLYPKFVVRFSALDHASYTHYRSFPTSLQQPVYSLIIYIHTFQINILQSSA